MPPAPTATPARVKLPALNDSQVVILQALAKCPPGTGLTRERLAATGAAVNAGNVGPAFKSVLENYPGSLYGLGLVRPVQHPDEEMVWEATVRGRQLAASYKARRRVDADKIAPAVLDPVVKKFLPSRTYGLELYTDDDLKEIRTALGAAHAEIPLTALRAQIVNRRKQGAFVEPKDRARAAASRCLREFGVTGTVVEGLLTDAQVERLEALVAGE